MEPLKHECGVAMVRLLRPLEHYQQKYGTWMYGLNKLYLLMEKQHNRGQEGAGLACVKLQAAPGEEYMFRERALGSGAISEIFAAVHENFRDMSQEQLHDAELAMILSTSQGTPMWITLLLDMRSSHGCFRHMAIMSES